MICNNVQVASWGAYLLSRNILTVSFAPRDTHEAQVQFALERGVPALIGILASKRLPYPSRAFDMAHCSRCLIPWGRFGNFTCPSIRASIILLYFSKILFVIKNDHTLCLVYNEIVNHIKSGKLYKLSYCCRETNYTNISYHCDMII